MEAWREMMMRFICEAVAVEVSSQRMWVSRQAIRTYLEEYAPSLVSDRIGSQLSECLKQMVESKILIQRSHSYTYYSAETCNVPSVQAKVGRKKKTGNDPEKFLGHEVVITRSGRVSMKMDPWLPFIIYYSSKTKEMYLHTLQTIPVSLLAFCAQ